MLPRDGAKCALGVLIKDEQGEQVLDVDVVSARGLLRDMRELDAVDAPKRMEVEHTIQMKTTTTIRERVVELLGKAQGRLPVPIDATAEEKVS